MLFLSCKDGFISHFLEGHSHTEAYKKVLCFLKWLWFFSQLVLSVLLLEFFKHRQSVSWQDLPVSSQWTAAPYCPVCKGKGLTLSSQSLHLFQRQSKAEVTRWETRLNPQFPCEHFENLTQPEWLGRLWSALENTKPWVSVGSWNWSSSKVEGCRELMFDKQSMWNCCVLVNLESHVRLYIKQAYFLQRKKKNIVAMSKNAEALTGAEPADRLVLNSLKVAFGRSIRQFCEFCPCEPQLLESPRLGNGQDLS